MTFSGPGPFDGISTHDRLAQIEPLLRWFADHDLTDDLHWTTHGSPLMTYDGEPSGEIRFFILCNDLFWWGTADAEWITAEDLPDLQRAYDDLVALGEVNELYTPELWVARKRGMRPQRPWLSREGRHDTWDSASCLRRPGRSETRRTRDDRADLLPGVGVKEQGAAVARYLHETGLDLLLDGLGESERDAICEEIAEQVLGSMTKVQRLADGRFFYVAPEGGP